MAAHFFKYLFVTLLAVVFTAFDNPARGQYFELIRNKKQSTIPFRVIRNMVIIRLFINSKGPFNFILDTGVGMMIITDPSLLDSLNIASRHVLRLSGVAGLKTYEACLSRELSVNMPGLQSVNVGAAVLKEDHFGLSNFAGIPIHGLLGYEFFNKLVVKLDFSDSTLTVYRPGVFKANRKYEKIPVTIEQNKPFINSAIGFCDKTERNCRLVVDIGAGHPLSLDNRSINCWPTDKTINANLGMGFTGPVNGEVSRVNYLKMGTFIIRNILSSFPEAVPDSLLWGRRDGNLGLDILKRFNVIFDYEGGCLYLKPRGSLNEPFERDMSGLEYYAIGDEFNHVIIDRVEPGSAADAIGLRKDDELVSVNFKPVAAMNLEQLDGLFRSGNGLGLLLEIYRDKKYQNVVIFLKRRI